MGRLLGLGLLLVLLACTAPPRDVPTATLEPADLTAVASVFGPAPGAPTPRLQAYRGPVLVVLRRHGLRLAESWGEGSDWWDNLRTAARQAREKTKEQPTSVELCFGHDLEPHLGKLGKVHTGVLGLEVEAQGQRKRMAPTQMLARNLSFPKALRTLVDINQVPPDQVRVFTFQAEQVLVQLGDPPVARRMLRGNLPVGLEEVTPERLTELRDDLGGWLLANMQPDGRLVYKYWPSRGEESPLNNPLRQFMAAWVLESWPAGRQAAARNLAYDLKTFYRPGEIVYRDEVKLGAMAMAALAIMDSPERARYGRQLEALVGTVESLARPDGSFRTFLRPEKRQNDNQNFYSGEAQLLRAHLYAEHPEPAALARFMKTMGYYRAWFRRRPNPAFVPWHTRACVLVYRHHPDDELRAFVFEMNDWLLGKAAMQEWDDAAYPDLQGRFYNPRRPDYGPPHASSTGAYLEGLCQAYALARDTGDETRAERYRTALLRGARDLLQLEFKDEVDLFYVSRPERVRGGLRTEVYDNELRVDNVQHALSAVQSMLQVLYGAQGQR